MVWQLEQVLDGRRDIVGTLSEQFFGYRDGLISVGNPPVRARGFVDGAATMKSLARATILS